MAKAAPATEQVSARPNDGTQSLRRAVHLLRTLSTHMRTGWRLSDLADEARLDHATAHRLLAGLVDERLVARVPGTLRYTLGPFAYELGVVAAPHYALDQIAAPALSSLAASTRNSVFLNVRSGFDSVCIARRDGQPAPKAYAVDVGTRRPLCLSAGGVAILVRLPRSEQIQIEVNNLEAISGRDAARRHSVRRMVHRSRRAGYGINLGDLVPRIAAVGVAICASTGNPVAALSVAGLAIDLEEPRRSALLVRLFEEATAIESQIGHLRY